MSSKDHYVINIDIKHVEFPGPNEAERRGAKGGDALNARYVYDVVHVVVTADTLAAAVEKAVGHLQIGIAT
jgi:hypothetical protein